MWPLNSIRVCLACAAIGAIGCNTDPCATELSAQAPGVVGPFTGTTIRFRVDALTLPRFKTDFATDLIGDGLPRNQLGNIVSTLTTQSIDCQGAANGYVAGGAAPWYLEVTSDDGALGDDPTVGVRLTTGNSGSTFDFAGALLGTVFTSNAIASADTPVAGTLPIPLFPNADPVHFRADAVEITEGRFAAGTLVLAGAVPAAGFVADATPAMLQMIVADIQKFSFYRNSYTVNGDGTVASSHLGDDGITAAVTAPDVRILDGHGHFHPCAHPAVGQKDSVTFGIALHIVPCPTDGSPCTPPPAVPTCADRIKNGMESDVDCGGPSCIRCPPNAICATDGDCETGTCNFGHCAAASCGNHRLDGFETDVDCGRLCPPCAPGKTCYADTDCASNHCIWNSEGTSGACSM